jgi:hypothetical protein
MATAEKPNEQTAGTSSHLMREVNDHICDVLLRLASEDGAFLCECGDPFCEEKVLITVREYEAHRARGEGPLLARAHELGAPRDSIFAAFKK